MYSLIGIQKDGFFEASKIPISGDPASYPAIDLFLTILKVFQPFATQLAHPYGTKAWSPRHSATIADSNQSSFNGV